MEASLKISLPYRGVPIEVYGDIHSFEAVDVIWGAVKQGQEYVDRFLDQTLPEREIFCVHLGVKDDETFKMIREDYDDVRDRYRCPCGSIVEVSK